MRFPSAVGGRAGTDHEARAVAIGLRHHPTLVRPRVAWREGAELNAELRVKAPRLTLRGALHYAVGRVGACLPAASVLDRCT